MAEYRVPVYDAPQVRQAPAPGNSMRLSVETSAAAFGEGLGKALGQVASAAEQEADKVNTSRVDATMAGLLPRVAEIKTRLTAETGETLLKFDESGKDGVGRSLEAFDKLVGEATKDLTPSQKFMLGREAARQRAALEIYGGAHRQNEQRKYDQDAQLALINNATTSAATSAEVGDLVGLKESTRVAAMAVEKLSAQLGIGKGTPQYEAFEREQMSKFHATVLTTLVGRKNMDLAKTYLDTNGQSLAPESRARFSGIISEGLAIKAGSAAGIELYDRVSKGELTLTQALKETTKLDPAAAEQAAGMLSSLNTAAKQDKIVAVSNAVGGLDSMRLEGQPTHAIKSSPMFITFSAEHPSEAREYLKGLEVEDRIRRQEYERGDRTRIDDSLAEVDSLLKLKNLMFEGDLRNKSESDIRSLAAGLLPKHRDDLVKVWAEVKGKPGWAPPLQALQSTLLNLGFNDRKGGLTPEGKALALKLIPQIRDITERSGSSVGMDQETLTKTISRLTTQFTLDKSWAKDPTIMGGELSKVLDDQETFKLFYRQKISDNFKDKIIAKWNQDPRFKGSVEATLGIYETQREIAKHWIRLYELGRIDPATGDLMAKE